MERVKKIANVFKLRKDIIAKIPKSLYGNGFSRQNSFDLLFLVSIKGMLLL